MSQVVKAYPPNYEQICAAIPAVRKNKHIVFTYGNMIYAPSGDELPPDFLAHEETHVERQTDPMEWWAKYLTDVQFRLDEELAAYRVQYAYAVEHYSRAQRRSLLTGMTKDLSGSMYGKIVSRKEAINLITQGAKI